MDAAKETGLRPVVGAELVCRKGSVFAFMLDRAGFSRLCEILTLLARGRDHPSDASPHAKVENLVEAETLTHELMQNSRGLVFASYDTDLLKALNGKVSRLYAAVTPRNVRALRTSSRMGIPLIALDDATLFDRNDRDVHRALRAIALGKNLGSLEASDETDGKDEFLSPELAEARLASWPEAIRASDALVKDCLDVGKTGGGGLFDGFIFPDYSLAEGIKPEDVLRRRVYKGAEGRYGEISDAAADRIEYELEIIAKKGFASYFLLMDDIVSMAPRTCGRGSGAASIVSYALSITNVDPIAHSLYFERFLNMARADPPDIDVDFPWDERDSLIRRVIERFGKDRCARVANHGFFRFRSAFRETAKAYGFSEAEISRAERRIIEQNDPGIGEEPLWKEIVSLARRIEGLPRGLSMHCGGLVISPGPMTDYAPVETSAEGYPLLAWEKEGTEASGLVKLDLLGNRSLAVIRDALAALAEDSMPIDFGLIQAENDLPTIEALGRGDSMGVFYIESPAMRQLQKKTGKGDFGHIVIHSSIIRPAANRYIAEYIRRLKGGTWKPLHPRLETILDETYGILCYQEDVSKTAIALAGFDEADADGLRKIIAKKSGGKRLELFKERFFVGCRKNDIPESSIEEIWNMMLSFDGYSFCKPHSASYAMVSFQSAYLRVHHPAYFMAAVLTNQGGFYRPQAYISESRRMGLRIIGPDVNESLHAYSAKDSTLTIGLMAVSGLSKSGAEELILQRKAHGPYKTLQDVYSRIRLARNDILALTAAGVFDSLAQGAPRSFQARTLMIGTANTEQGSSLFIAAEPKAAYGNAADVSAQDRASEMVEEFHTLGFLRDHHPLRLWAAKLSGIRRIVAADMGRYVNSRVCLVGWPVTRKDVWTKDGLPMNFMSFEDETAMYETVLFPEVFETYKRMLFDMCPFVVIGVPKDDMGALCLEVSSVRTL